MGAVAEELEEVWISVIFYLKTMGEHGVNNAAGALYADKSIYIPGAKRPDETQLRKICETSRLTII